MLGNNIYFLLTLNGDILQNHCWFLLLYKLCLLFLRIYERTKNVIFVHIFIFYKNKNIIYVLYIFYNDIIKKVCEVQFVIAHKIFEIILSNSLYPSLFYKLI